MKVYNSLSRSIETVTPLHRGQIGMYTCGPTVYSFVTIGNLRTFVTSDLLLRALKYEGNDVHFVMNITDVGHLTGDNEGDASQGEDRLEKSAKKEGKDAWHVAQFYTEAFLKDAQALHLVPPQELAKATDHIPEQIALIKRLEEKGFAYTIEDGLYFDTVQYESVTHNIYGELSNLDKILEGARIEANPQKKNPRDFALWKFSYPNGRNFNGETDDEAQTRHMEWESPWGIGFPGWHIECSAMSMKYLGESFDIHAGGEDLKSTHHPNEIAQSEGATGKQFAKYWVHSAFLLVDGKRMGKSLGNAYTVTDILQKGFDPLSLRYFYMTGHYRSPLNFTWEGLTAAQNALGKLQSAYRSFTEVSDENRTELSEEKLSKVQGFRDAFQSALSDDLNMPATLAVVWEMVKSNIPSPDKRDLLLLFDEVLGFNLKDIKNEDIAVPAEITALLAQRDHARAQKNFSESDRIRQVLEEKGYTVKDGPEGSTVILSHVAHQS